MVSAFDATLEAIARHDILLSRRIRESAPSPRVVLGSARNGMATATVVHERQYHLHSAMDPGREAEKLVAGANPDGCVICLGIGLGYHLQQILARDEVQLVLVIDFDLSLVRSLLEGWIDSGVINDPRMHLMIDPSSRDVADWVTRRYLPVLHGNLQTFTLRGRVDADAEVFAGAARAAADAAQRAVGDFQVHQVFARQWMRNIVINATTPRRKPPPPPRLTRAVITAAGPSLESALPSIATERDRLSVVATDTSLPALAAAGIVPDLVVAVDAQVVSYLHVADSGINACPLVADLGVHHVVADRFAEVRWVSGGHPLVSYLRDRGWATDHLETGDGSVTHSCVRLALSLGATDVRVVGADFGYPRAVAYARGSYIPAHALQHGNRLNPAFSWLYRFVMDRPGLSGEHSGGSTFYTTPILSGYHRTLGYILDQPLQPRPHPPLATNRCAGGRPATVILRDYRVRLMRLAPPSSPLWLHWTNLDEKSRQLWLTLLPLAAYRFRQGRSDRHVLEQARREAISLLEALLPGA